MLKTQPIPYDYGPYDGELAMMLQGQAERIRARITKQTADMLETGRDLLAVRGELDHGRFEGWVETACRISPRLARMYMRAAEWADNECEYRKLVSDLEPTAVIELAKKSTPDTVRCAVADQLKAGRPVHTRTVRELATTAREARKSDKTDGPKEKPETVAELRVIMERQAREIDKLKKRLAKADETIAEKEAQRAAQESRAIIAEGQALRNAQSARAEPDVTEPGSISDPLGALRQAWGAADLAVRRTFQKKVGYVPKDWLEDAGLELLIERGHPIPGGLAESRWFRIGIEPPATPIGARLVTEYKPYDYHLDKETGKYVKIPKEHADVEPEEFAKSHRDFVKCVIETSTNLMVTDDDKIVRKTDPDDDLEPPDFLTTTT